MVKKVLIVDDEKDILESVKILIETKGSYETGTASSGKEALEILRKEKFDLVLLDVLMPEMSGIDVLKKIRADPNLKNQKVAMLTVVQLGKSGEDTIKKLKPVEYFRKPIDVADFKKRLEKIL